MKSAGGFFLSQKSARLSPSRLSTTPWPRASTSRSRASIALILDFYKLLPLEPFLGFVDRPRQEASQFKIIHRLLGDEVLAVLTGQFGREPLTEALGILAGGQPFQVVRDHTRA